MIDYKFKGLKYYQSIKGKTMNTAEFVWCNNGYRNPDRVGYNMYLVTKYQPCSLEDFFNKYISDYTTIDDPLHGRNIGMIETLAIAFKEDAEKKNSSLNMTVEDYMDIIVLHAVVETWEGYQSEKEIKDMLIKEGNSIVDCNDIFWEIHPELEAKGMCFDNWSSIDIVSRTGDVINRLIQIKPISTFISNHPKTIQDRLNFDWHNMDGISFIKKHLPYKVSNNIYVRYMAYHKNNDGTISWYYTTNDEGKKRFNFMLKELLDTNFANKLNKTKSFSKII